MKNYYSIQFVKGSASDTDVSGSSAPPPHGRFVPASALGETLETATGSSDHSEVLNCVRGGSNGGLAVSHNSLSQRGVDGSDAKRLLSRQRTPSVGLDLGLNRSEVDSGSPEVQLITGSSTSTKPNQTKPNRTTRSSSGLKSKKIRSRSGGSGERVSSGTDGNCRQFKQSMTRILKSATSTVSRLCEVQVKQPALTGTTCLSLYKEVKQFLSQEISDQPEVQMAFQSIKKLLPDSCPCMAGTMLSDLKVRLSRPPPRLPPGYVQHCKKVLLEIFEHGWDRSWDSKVSTFSPSLGSCSENSRSKGGQLSSLASKGQDAWRSELETHTGHLSGELLLVNSAGKPRPLTKFSSESAFLRPLHGLLYDQISKQPWLLRGDVTGEKLASAGFTASGADLVSGDYVSASDNLPIEIAELILDVAWSRSNRIPASNLAYAYSAQRPLLRFRDENHMLDEFVPTIGQMMGSYLCFPLLCLQNYLAFRWACRDRVVPPVLINGDDILFQSSDLFEHWSETIKDVGFEVEKSKTSLSPIFGTINSTLVKRVSGNLIVARTLRMGMLRRPEHPGALGDSFEKFSKVGKATTWYKKGIEFLNWHSKTILSWGCLAQDMRFFGRLARSCWKRAFNGCLWRREKILIGAGLDYLAASPSPHTVVMRSNEFERLEPEQVTPELERATARWMAARKWELGTSFERVKSNKQRITRQSYVLNSGLDKRLLGNKKSLLNFFRGPVVVPEEKKSRLYGPTGESVIRQTIGRWLRPKPKTSVRVPRPLLEEFGLVTRGASVDEVLANASPELFPLGAKMLWNHSAFETVKVKLNMELQCSLKNLAVLKAREGD